MIIDLCKAISGRAIAMFLLILSREESYVIVFSRFEDHCSSTLEVAGICGRCGPDAGAGHWRDDGDLFHRRRCLAASAAVSGAGPADGGIGYFAGCGAA